MSAEIGGGSPTGLKGLPRELSSFVGREWEVVAAGEALVAARLLTLTGAGGCGKTRLALEVATRAGAGFEDGAVWVDFAPLRDGTAVPGAIARAVDVRPQPGVCEVDAIVGLLATRHLLVVLDNCEHLVAAAAEAVAALLRGTAEVTVLATSRMPLGVPGEHDWRVPSLGLPPEGDDAGASDAVRLFVERARLACSAFVPTEQTRPTVVEICRRLDGIPLAIELAAARLRMLSAAQVAAGLDDALRIVATGARTAPPRQRTLRASIEWSHDLLEPQARVLLRRLGVFADGFTLELAEAVCADERLPGASVLDLLAGLVEHSLVQVATAGGTARYRLLEVVRQFARAQLDGADERNLFEERHAGALLAFACALERQLIGPRQPELLAALDAERANLAAAQLRLETVDPDAAVRLCLVLWIWQRARGAYDEGAAVLERAIGRADGAPSPLYARALAAWAWMVGSRGDRPAGLGIASEALAMAESVGDAPAVAEALLVTANLTAITDPAGARPLLERSRAIGEDLGDDWILQRCDLYLAMADWCQQRTRDCLALLPRQRARAGRVADRRTLSFIAAMDGYTRYAALDHGQAVERLFEAIALAREAGDPLAELAAEVYLALFDVSAGRFDEGLEKLQRLRARLLPSGGAAYTPWVTLFEAIARAAGGDLAAGGRTLSEVPEAVPHAHVWAQAERAEIMRLMGAPGTLEQAETALEQARALDNDWLASKALTTLGRLDAAAGQWSRARRRHHEALEAIERCEGWLELAPALEGLAAVEAGVAQPRRAARLLGAAERFRRERGPVPWPAHAAEVAAVAEQVRGSLDDAAYEEATGASGSVAELLTWVRRGRGGRRNSASGWESLTPAEHEVLALAAEGLSNPEIAERLFMSRSTVKRHLGQAFAKLGVSNRTELARLVARAGAKRPPASAGA